MPIPPSQTILLAIFRLLIRHFLDRLRPLLCPPLRCLPVPHLALRVLLGWGASHDLLSPEALTSPVRGQRHQRRHHPTTPYILENGPKRIPIDPASLSLPDPSSLFVPSGRRASAIPSTTTLPRKGHRRLVAPAEAAELNAEAAAVEHTGEYRDCPPNASCCSPRGILCPKSRS